MASVRSWLIRAIPRAVILATAVAELVRGDPVYAAFCVLALAITLLPPLLARRLDAVPIELELALLWLMVSDLTLGNLLELYARFPWYDKALHLGSSALVAVIGFLAVYALHAAGRTRRRPWLDGLAIVLVTLGAGAMWEIGEYAVDRLLGRASQRAPGLTAIDDTMIDLVLDAIGGVIGAIAGPRYLRRSRRTRERIEAFARDLGRRERTTGARGPGAAALTPARRA